MSWLDALLGNIQSRGNAVESQGTLNFVTPLQAVANSAQGRIDVSIDHPAVTLDPLDGRTRGLGDVCFFDGTDVGVYLYDGVGTDLDSEGAPGWTLQFSLAKPVV